MKRTVITIAVLAMLAMPAVLSAQQPKNLQIGPNTTTAGGT
jgi:hypothetical protein